MQYTTQERNEYNIQRAKECALLGIQKNQYNSFRLLGEKLRNLYVMNCNGEINEEDYESKTQELYVKADKKAADLGLFIYYQTDPRGASLYLSTDPMTDSNYSMNGWAIV